jgi:hypothetical protein
MISWRRFPDISSDRLPPFDGKDFLLAQRTDWSHDHEPDFEAYYVLVAFFDREEGCFYHRVDGPAEQIPYPCEEESFWSEINVPDRRG